jgi:hydrogenase maturation factor
MMNIFSCQSGDDHHCLTCADEAVPVRVVQLDQEAGLALCSLLGATSDLVDSVGEDQVEEIDITLVEGVAVGDILLAHAGVAIGYQESSQR